MVESVQFVIEAEPAHKGVLFWGRGERVLWY